MMEETVTYSILIQIVKGLSTLSATVIVIVN